MLSLTPNRLGWCQNLRLLHLWDIQPQDDWFIFINLVSRHFWIHLQNNLHCLHRSKWFLQIIIIIIMSSAFCMIPEIWALPSHILSWLLHLYPPPPPVFFNLHSPFLSSLPSLMWCHACLSSLWPGLGWDMIGQSSWAAKGGAAPLDFHMNFI